MEQPNSLIWVNILDSRRKPNDLVTEKQKYSSQNSGLFLTQSENSEATAEQYCC